MQRRYLQIFLDEATQILGDLNQRILELERPDGDPKALESAMRHAHTLKGGAKMVGLDNVSGAAHRMESALKEAGASGCPLDAQVCSEALTTLDRIREALTLVAAGREGEALQLALDAPVVGATGHGAGAVAPRSRVRTPVAAEVSGEPSARRLGADRVRVGVERLDQLQNLVDDLTLQKHRIFAHVDRLRRSFSGLEKLTWEAEDRPFTTMERRQLLAAVREFTGRRFATLLEELHALDQMTSEVHDQVFDLRMVPLAEVLDEYHSRVRDLARDLGKDVGLTVDGRFTEIDKRLLESIQAPLMHLLRNALDHGIETADERRAAGKPARGVVTIRAYHKGGAVVIEVEDDGRGLDPAAVRNKAVQRGLRTREAADATPDQEILYLLCEPGFSTRDAVTELSGRGVGLDVVKVRLEKLKGSLSIQSRVGEMSRFRMYLPLSISSLSVLTVRCGPTLFAVPSLFVDHCFRVEARQLAERSGNWTYGGKVAPVVSLASVLGVATTAPPERVYLVVLQYRSRYMILQVDALESEQEVVLKPLGNHLREVPYVSGVTFLPSGEPVPVLNIPDVHAHWTTLETAHRFDRMAVRGPRSVLVVDDSMTTRHMESNVLRALGYRVAQAADGLEAWALLQKEEVDVVITDVEMPNLDGLELTKRIRGSDRLSDMPVVVVSSRAADEDLEAGMLAGADAYIPKGRFSQRELSETLRGLLAARRSGGNGAPTGGGSRP